MTFKITKERSIFVKKFPGLGARSDIVLALSKVIPPNQNNLLYFNNCFTC